MVVWRYEEIDDEWGGVFVMIGEEEGLVCFVYMQVMVWFDERRGEEKGGEENYVCRMKFLRHISNTKRYR